MDCGSSFICTSKNAHPIDLLALDSPQEHPVISKPYFPTCQMKAPDTTLENSVISVFGGGAGWGKKIASSVEGVAKDVIIIEQENGVDEQQLSARSADIVFLATPDSEIDQILHTIRDDIGSAVLLDCATNKGDFADTLKEIAQHASVCSTHPMVRSETPSRGHNVILMPIGDHSGKAVAAASALYERLGMDIHMFDFENHKDLMVLLQTIPHLTQRVLIQSLAEGLEEKGMSLKDITRFAPANYMMTELGMGRVATQKPDVSAGIIAEGLKTSFGKSIFQRMKTALDDIQGADGDRSVLVGMFNSSVQKLDPEQNWRDEMLEKTDVILERTGNLKRRSCQIYAPNRPGVLAQITNILHLLFNIDMNALDSNIRVSASGDEEVRFDIGLADQSSMNEEGLRKALEAVGARITVIHEPESTDV